MIKETADIMVKPGVQPTAFNKNQNGTAEMNCPSWPALATYCCNFDAVDPLYQPLIIAIIDIKVKLSPMPTSILPTTANERTGAKARTN